MWFYNINQWQHNVTRNILKIDNVKKTYRRYNLLGKEITKFPALNGLNLNLDKGQIYGFLGPNGAGKTTTIKCIVGILEADSGDILICLLYTSPRPRDRG